MRTIVWDQNSDNILLVPEGKNVPHGNFVYGILHNEADPPIAVLDIDSFDAPVNIQYFSRLLNAQYGIEVALEDILQESDGEIRMSKTAGMKLYHTGPAGLKELSPNQSGGFTQEGIWAHEIYGMNPIFLSKQPWNTSGEVYEIDFNSLDPSLLKADLPSLVDHGLYVEEDYGWFEDDPGFGLPIEASLHEYADMWKESFALTGTLAYLGDIPLSQQKQSNILDPIHDTLDQRVFNGITPKLDFFKAHLHHIREVFRQYGFDPTAFDFYLTGSLCTYQYSWNSDVDISISTDHEFSDEDRAELVSIVVNSLDGPRFPGTDYRFQHFIQPEGINIHDLFAIGMRAGYDFQKEEWVVKPSRAKAKDIKKSHPDWIAEAILVSDKMNTLIDSGFNKEAIEMYKDVHHQRKQDQLSRGDESLGNIIYKFLDNNGTFDRLRNIGKRISHWMPGWHAAILVPNAHNGHDFYVASEPRMTHPNTFRDYLGTITNRDPSKIPSNTYWRGLYNPQDGTLAHMSTPEELDDINYENPGREVAPSGFEFGKGIEKAWRSGRQANIIPHPINRFQTVSTDDPDGVGFMREDNDILFLDPTKGSGDFMQQAPHLMRTVRNNPQYWDPEGSSAWKSGKWRLAMPYEPSKWQEHLDKSNGEDDPSSYVYHDPNFNKKLDNPSVYKVMQNILTNGLNPRIDSSSGNFDDHLRSRPDHVYLGENDFYDSRNSRPAFRINKQNLDPRLINPDEDYFHNHPEANRILNEEGVPGYDEWLENYDPGMDEDELLDDSGSLRVNDYFTLGDWAEQHGDYLDDYAPEGMEASRTMAYNGSIPSEHIEIDPNWLYEHLQRDNVPDWLKEYAKEKYPDIYEDASLSKASKWKESLNGNNAWNPESETQTLDDDNPYQDEDKTPKWKPKRQKWRREPEEIDAQSEALDSPSVEKWLKAAWRERVSSIPAPGETPIPEGHYRFYHYTRGNSPEEYRQNLNSIKQNGLQLDQARGESYGEPNLIWGSGSPPDDRHHFVEFHVPRDFEGWDIGKPWMEKGHSPQDYADRGTHVTFLRNIPPENIVATHEPWHRAVKYIQELKPKEVKELEELLNKDNSDYLDEYRIAMKYLKDNNKLAKTSSRDNNGVMIAVEPENPEKYAIEGGEPADILHCTLVYLDGEADSFSDEEIEELKNITSRFAQYQDDIEGTLTAMATFTGDGSGDPAQVGLVSCVGLDELRSNLVRAVKQAGFKVSEKYGWVPHMTLAYQNDPVNLPEDNSIKFRKLTLRVAEEPFDYYFEDEIGEDRKDIGIKDEKEEHPSFDMEDVETIVEDHLRIDPSYYDENKESKWKESNWNDNVWYHVTKRENLQSIRDHGLAPIESLGQGKNFSLPVGEKVVYLHPNVSGAVSYASKHSQLLEHTRTNPSDWIILRISNIDKRRLLPDHEEFQFRQDDYMDSEPDNPMMEYYYDYMDSGEEEWNGGGFNESLDYLMSLPLSQREKLISHWSEFHPTSAVMYLGTIPAQNIDIVGSTGFSEEAESGKWNDVQDQWRDYQDYMENMGVDETYPYDDETDQYSNMFQYKPMFSKWKTAKV